MAYATQTDIENLFGTANVARWSQLDNTSTDTNTTRITLALTVADAMIDDRFRGSVYAVPFTTVPTMVTQWAAKFAGVWLYSSRGINNRAGASGEEADQRILFHQKTAMEEIDFYVSGRRKFPTTVVTSVRGGTSPWVVGVTPMVGGGGA